MEIKIDVMNAAIAMNLIIKVDTRNDVHVPDAKSKTTVADMKPLENLISSLDVMNVADAVIVLTVVEMIISRKWLMF